MCGKIGEYAYRVESFHLDCTEHLSLSVLGNQILNAAARHAESCGFGRETMRSQGLAWVFSRLLIQMEHYPLEFDTYTIRTWIADVTCGFSHRNFAILDATGQVVGYASSVWALMDLSTRQAVDLMAAVPGYVFSVCTADELPPCPLERTRRVRVDNASPSLSFRPLFCDIDYNGHFNSIRYIEYFLNALPMDVCSTHPVSRIEISYSIECHYGEPLDIYSKSSHDSEYDMEMRRADGAVACRAKVTFSLDNINPIY